MSSFKVYSTMRVVAYAITLIATVAVAVLAVTTLVKSSGTVPCMSCLLSRAVVTVPGQVEGHGSYVLVGTVAVPNVTNIHVTHRHVIVTYGPSRLPSSWPIVKIGLPTVHVPGSAPPCRIVKHVHALYRVLLYLRMVSHGSCGITDIVKIVASIHMCDSNAMSFVLKIEKVKGYVKVERLNSTAVKVYMEDCDCCDFDYKDEVYIINLRLDSKTLVLHLVQAKGGYSHDVYLNDTKWFHKPGGAIIRNKIKHVELKLVKKWSTHETICG